MTVFSWQSLGRVRRLGSVIAIAVVCVLLCLGGLLGGVGCARSSGASGSSGGVESLDGGLANSAPMDPEKEKAVSALMDAYAAHLVATVATADMQVSDIQLVPVESAASLLKSAGVGSDSVSVSVDIYASIFNRILEEQFRNSLFTRKISGEAFGSSYVIYLKTPAVVFSDNQLKLKLDFQLISSLGTFDFSISPIVKIKDSSIALSDIVATLQGVSDEIKKLNIPSWVMDAVVQEYSGLEFVLYPSKLIQELNPAFIRQRRFSLTDAALSWAVNDDHLTFTVSFFYSPDRYNFPVGFCLNGNRTVSAWVMQESRVVSFQILDTRARALINSKPNTWVSKNQKYSVDIDGNWPTSVYFVSVLLETNDTVYLANGKFAVVAGKVYGNGCFLPSGGFNL